MRSWPLTCRHTHACLARPCPSVWASASHERAQSCIGPRWKSDCRSVRCDCDARVRVDRRQAHRVNHGDARSRSQDLRGRGKFRPKSNWVRLVGSKSSSGRCPRVPQQRKKAGGEQGLFRGCGPSSTPRSHRHGELVSCQSLPFAARNRTATRGECLASARDCGLRLRGLTPLRLAYSPAVCVESDGFRPLV